MFPDGQLVGLPGEEVPEPVIGGEILRSILKGLEVDWEGGVHLEVDASRLASSYSA